MVRAFDLARASQVPLIGIVTAFITVAATWVTPAEAQMVVRAARDSGRLVGMGVVCGGEVKELALQHVALVNVFLNRGVTDLFRNEAAVAFTDSKDLAAATQSAGRGFACGEVQVLLRQATRDMRSYLDQLGVR